MSNVSVSRRKARIRPDVTVTHKFPTTKVLVALAFSLGFFLGLSIG